MKDSVIERLKPLFVKSIFGGKILAAAMTNFDGTIDRKIISKLLKGKNFAQYSAWDFCGYVWFDLKTRDWKCEVWIYHVKRDEFTAKTPDDLMKKIVSVYGSK